MQKSGQYFEFKSLRLLFVLKDTVIRLHWAQPPECRSSTGVSSVCSLQEDARDPTVTGISTPCLWTLLLALGKASSTWQAKETGGREHSRLCNWGGESV